MNLYRKFKIDDSLTPIEKLSRSIQVGRKSSILKVTRVQFPLVPSSAITIHKSQGDTYENVFVHLGDKYISRRMLYVALSRAKSANGLFIITNEFKNPKPISEYDPMLLEMKRLKKDRMIQINET